MGEKPKNPAAFACACENGHQEGMSLRDWFAGQALAGYLADSETIKAMKAEAKKRSCGANAIIAEAAFEAADAMLAERERQQ